MNDALGTPSTIHADRRHKEEVLGLPCGTLSDTNWPALDENGVPQDYAYWWEGVPEYLPSGRWNPADGEARAVLLVSAAPETLTDDSGCWTRVDDEPAPAEAECPYRYADEGNACDARPCFYCEASEGERHGFVVLGEGWHIAVYGNRQRREDGQA